MPIMVTYYQPPCSSCETEIFLLCCVLFPLKYLRMLHLSGNCQDSGKYSKMAARNRVQYHPPPPISFCEGPRIIQKLKDVVVQILELPLYISILFDPEYHHLYVRLG